MPKQPLETPGRASAVHSLLNGECTHRPSADHDAGWLVQCPAAALTTYWLPLRCRPTARVLQDLPSIRRWTAGGCRECDLSKASARRIRTCTDVSSSAHSPSRSVDSGQS